MQPPPQNLVVRARFQVSVAATVELLVRRVTWRYVDWDNNTVSGLLLGWAPADRDSAAIFRRRAQLAPRLFVLPGGRR